MLFDFITSYFVCLKKFSSGLLTSLSAVLPLAVRQGSPVLLLFIDDYTQLLRNLALDLVELNIQNLISFHLFITHSIF